ncbi:MAG: aminotransferase class V-fold PLP-dependent enzyme, partial [Ktedonobacteraceae bacterium]|nr:aminotransferase class V-fold PLP-dependent enzyme [Ktedonobacteraceae bacterium]
AGSALTSQPVLDASIAYLQREAQIGGYEAATEAHEALEHTSLAAAKLIGAAREEIALADSADSAWNRAFYSIPFKPGDRVLTSKAEYHSNYIVYLQAQKRLGITIEAVPNDEHGQLDITALRQMLDERVRLISITYVTISSKHFSRGEMNAIDPSGRSGQITIREFDDCKLVWATSDTFV